MNLSFNFVLAPILLVIVAFDLKCSGKYVTNNLLDVFAIQKLGTISAHCKLNQTFSECDGNLNSTIDGDSYTFWRGPSLVNGNEFPEVKIDIDFDEAIHIAKFSIDFVGSKHAPAVWSLEQSADFGETWRVWQYFVKDPDNCELLGITSSSSNEVSYEDNEICSMHSYAKNNRVVVDLMDTELLKSNTDLREALEERSLTTNIRLHFYEWKVNIQPLKNSKIGENYFYAVNEIEILGYCERNGHFIGEPTAFGYQCDHNTTGICCRQCKKGFEKSEWKPYTKDQPFECESCNCNGHSNRCIFDESQGDDICQDCQHNTEGTNCNRCKAGFYRPHGQHWNSTSACQPCNCDAHSLTGNCTEETGQCECKPGYDGAECATCSPGFVLDSLDCKPCSAHGTDVNQSNPNECSCKPNFTGKFCDECICSDFKHPHCNEIDRIRSELAKVEDMTNFTDNCRSADFGLSFLHVATMHGLTDFITELAEFGAKNLVDSVDRINQTPIFYGIAFGKKNAVAELIRLGANIKCQVDDYGLAPLDEAKAVGDKEIIEILENAGARESGAFSKLAASFWYEIGALPKVPEKYEKKLQKEAQMKAKCS